MNSSDKQLCSFRWLDLLLYGFMFAGSFAVYSSAVQKGGGERVVIIERNGEVIRRFPLGDNMQIQLTEFSSTIHVDLHNQQVQIKSVDCPGQVCRRVGAISRPGESIVCVPNKLLIYIEGSGSESVPPRLIIG